VNDKEGRSWSERLGRYFWLIGPVGLVAWFGLLWLMFGDVL